MQSCPLSQNTENYEFLIANILLMFFASIQNGQLVITMGRLADSCVSEVHCLFHELNLYQVFLRIAHKPVELNSLRQEILIVLNKRSWDNF
jgi:hypothetical protein